MPIIRAGTTSETGLQGALKFALAEAGVQLQATALTMGNFDGVHRGHQHVLTELTRQARHRGIPSVVITFEPHPAVIHRPDQVPELLTGQEEKAHQLLAQGVDVVVVLEYLEQLAAYSPSDFVAEFFVDALAAQVVVFGNDMRFGKNNSGTFDTLQDLGQQLGFDVISVEDLDAEPADGGTADPLRCSSTAIRAALAQGSVESAATMLGRYHAVIGEVVHGYARGRELGYPTANLSQDSTGMIPADGVYAGWLHSDILPKLPIAISVGSNPTFDGFQRVVEAHVMGRPEEPVEAFNLYELQVRVEFVAWLRGMVAYEGVEKLIEQMREDVERATEVLAETQQNAGSG